MVVIITPIPPLIPAIFQLIHTRAAGQLADFFQNRLIHRLAVAGDSTGVYFQGCKQNVLLGIHDGQHIFVLRTNQPQPQQKGAEGERRVIPDGRFPELRVLLVDALRRDRHSQNDVGFGFTRMERRVEQPPLDCAMVEHRMQVQGVMLSST